jgi:hypothetical protein
MGAGLRGQHPGRGAPARPLVATTVEEQYFSARVGEFQGARRAHWATANHDHIMDVSHDFVGETF